MSSSSEWMEQQARLDAKLAAATPMPVGDPAADISKIMSGMGGINFSVYFPTSSICVDYLTAHRWEPGHGAWVCVRCGRTIDE